MLNRLALAPDVDRSFGRRGLELGAQQRNRPPIAERLATVDPVRYQAKASTAERDAGLGVGIDWDWVSKHRTDVVTYE